MPKNSSSQANYSDIFQKQFLDLFSNLNISGGILITGAQGMLGNALACALKELQSKKILNNSKIILCSRNWDLPAAKKWQNYSNVEVITNDNLLNRYHSIDFVIHTASPSNITKITTLDDLLIPNLELLKNIFKLNPKKILYISSGEVYGGNLNSRKQLSTNFTYSSTRDWYPLVKLETERVLHHFGEMHNVQTMIVRLFHTFGPGLKANDGRSFADILWGAVNNKQIILNSSGTQTRTFLYISDAVSGILKTLFTAKNNQTTLNLGSEIPLTIKEFAELVSRHTGASIHIKIDDNFKHSKNQYLIPNLDIIKNLNWEPRVDIDTGIAYTIKWIQNINLNINII